MDDKGQSESASDQPSPKLDMISGASTCPSISSEQQVRPGVHVAKAFAQ